MKQPTYNRGKHQQKYSERAFWKKLNKYAKRIGRKTVEQILCLYYAAQSPHTPAWAKAKIYGVLAYLIWPLDAIPDVIPIKGFTDDIVLILAAIAVIGVHITENIKSRARKKTNEWFS